MPNQMAWFLCVLAAAQAGDSYVSRTTLPSFYHTSDQLNAELDRLTKKCPGWSRETRRDHSLPEGRGPELDVVRIKLPISTPEGGGHRVAMVFGEHARELITVETSLHFMRALCGEIDAMTGLSSLMQKNIGDSGDGSSSESDGDTSHSRTSPSSISSLLGQSTSELLIFPNANPVSRRVVEQGDFCERLNPHGVDLNRNWDAHWIEQDVSISHDAPSGSKPFSEPESRIIRDTLAEYKPSFYLSVHSGNLGVFAPYAYASNAPQPASDTMSLLQKVSREYCKCPFGGAAHTIGYNCPGASIDYVYDTLHAKNSYAVEIWIGEHEQQPFHDRYEAQIKGKPTATLSSFLHQRHKRYAISKLHKDGLHSHGSFLEHKESKGSKNSVQGHDPGWCLQNFNPVHHDDYQDVLHRWTQAYLTLIKESPQELTPQPQDLAEHEAHRVM